MEYISVIQFAEKYGISERTARNYCAQGKIEGAFLTGKTWNIPADVQGMSGKRYRSLYHHRRTENVLLSWAQGVGAHTLELCSLATKGTQERLPHRHLPHRPRPIQGLAQVL